MYMQRYMQHFPAAGEIVIFDRSWYNRAGVEYVMGFCSDEQYRRFLELCPQVEKYIVDGGIILIKIWLEVGKEEQERRFHARIDDPLRQWKLSPMDLESLRALVRLLTRPRHDAQEHRQQTCALAHRRSDDKRRARLNCISHILKRIPFQKVPRPKVKLPKRSDKGRYDDQASMRGVKFVAEKILTTDCSRLA